MELFLFITKEPHLANFGSFSMDTPKKRSANSSKSEHSFLRHLPLSSLPMSTYNFTIGLFASSLKLLPSSIFLLIPIIWNWLLTHSPIVFRCPLRRSRLHFGAGLFQRSTQLHLHPRSSSLWHSSTGSRISLFTLHLISFSKTGLFFELLFAARLWRSRKSFLSS